MSLQRSEEQRLAVVRDHLNRQRLGPYLDACSGDLRTALGLYSWNTAVGSAFFESLGQLEIILRNVLDQALDRRHRRLSRAGDWLVRAWVERESRVPRVLAARPRLTIPSN